MVKEELTINGGKPVIKHKIKEKWRNITLRDILKVSKYLINGDLSVIDGGVMTEFEKKFANYVGAKYAVSYCNGTAALHAASYACGANKQSTFISSIYSYHGTIISLLENNSKVILVDYEPQYFTIDLDAVEKNITKDTTGIVITNCWGNLVNYDRLQKIKNKYNLKIIIDASHSHGSEYKDKKIGNIECEDITCFSLGKNKLMSAGELGIAVTNDKELYEKLLFFGHPNRIPTALDDNCPLKKYSNGIGNKYRPHSLALILGIGQLNRINKKIENNRKINNYLSKEINKIDGFNTAKIHSNCNRVYWKLQVFIDKKYWNGISNERIIQAIKKEGLTLEQWHNYDLESNLAIWENERYDGLIINTSKMSSPDNVIVLPGYIKISKKNIQKIIDVFKKISNKKEKLK